MHRFLPHGKRRALGWIVPLVLLSAALLAASVLRRPRQNELIASHRDWIIMGTYLEVTVYRPAAASSAADGDLLAAHRAVAEVDERMSLYRPDSELVALNERAGEGPIDVADPTLEVLEAAQHYGRLSGGAMDVTIQPIVELWGFYQLEATSPPPAAEIGAALENVGIDRVVLGAGTVALPAGTQLDLGAIAKGYAVDRALAELLARDVPAAFIDLGGSVGAMGRPPGNRLWRVGVGHPRGENQLLGNVQLTEGAVATSGDYERYLEFEGRRFSHLLDPRSGWPVEGVYAVTVIAPNGTAADALSTAAFVLGPEDGLALLARCEGVEGLVVRPVYKEGKPMELAVTMTPGLDAGGPTPFEVEPGFVGTPRVPQELVALTPMPNCVLPLFQSASEQLPPSPRLRP